MISNTIKKERAAVVRAQRVLRLVIFRDSRLKVKNENEKSNKWSTDSNISYELTSGKTSGEMKNDTHFNEKKRKL